MLYPHLGDLQAHPRLLRKTMQAQIAHHRHDDGILSQQSLLFHAGGAESHNLIAIHEVAPGVHSQTAVRVPVECKADVERSLPHRPL